MFKKKSNSSNPSSSLRTVSTEERREERRNATGLNRPQPVARRNMQDNGQPSSRTHPATSIGIARLMEAYDDYPVVVNALEVATQRLELSEQANAELEQKYFDLQDELKREQAARTADAEQAKKDKAEAEREREKKIRAELEPKIKTLAENLDKTTTDRNKLKTELDTRRGEMRTLVDKVQGLHKERRDAEEKETQAVEAKRKVDERLRNLDKDILDGLKRSSEVPGTGTAAKTGETAGETVTEEKPKEPKKESKLREYDW